MRIDARGSLTPILGQHGRGTFVKHDLLALKHETLGCLQLTSFVKPRRGIRSGLKSQPACLTIWEDRYHDNGAWGHGYKLHAP